MYIQTLQQQAGPIPYDVSLPESGLDWQKVGSVLRQQYATALKNVKKLSAGGVKIALGSNSGAPDTYPGSFELRR